MQVDIESLERATLDAVAPRALEHLAGWLLPFDSTTIGRAISAVPLQHQGLDPAAIGTIEARYAYRGLGTQFRIAETPGLTEFSDALLMRGYMPQHGVLTMVGGATLPPQAPCGLQVQITEQPTADWKSVYLSEDFDPVDGANRVQALSRSLCIHYAHICDASGPVAAGTCAMSHNWLSFHGMRTVQRARGMGYARNLIAALHALGRSKGYGRSFLQVEESNAPAIGLYRSLGFQTAWRYFYYRKAS